MDFKTVLADTEKLREAKTPTKFKPTHFHLSNASGLLGKKNAHTKLMFYKGKFFHMTTDNESGKRKIARWTGNVNNRAAWNPASVDGEIINGKLKEYPKGVTFADMQAKKELQKDADAPKDNGLTKSTQVSAKKADSPNQFLRNADKATADKEATKRIKRLIQLLDALEESANILRNSGILNERKLTSDEQNELMGIVADLKLLVRNPNLSNVNRRMINAQIPRVTDAVAGIRQQRASSQGEKEPVKVTPTDGDPGEKGAPQTSDELDADSKDNSTPEPKKAAKVVSGSLAKFRKSGKGGLANDPEEVEAIKELQQYLNDLGFDTGTVDGKYGRATIKGVKAFQKYFGAAVDGDAGPETIGQIIKLRSFMFSGTDFVQFRKDMDRLETLVGKIGAKESTDMSSMSSILETLRRLDEALSDAEKEELKSILDKYSALLYDTEFTAAMPKVSLDRYRAAAEKAKEATKDVATGKPSDKLDGKDGDLSTSGDTTSGGELTGKLDGKDGDMSSGSAVEPTDAVYKTVTGSGQGKSYKTFDKDGNEVSSGRGPGPTNLPSEEEYKATTEPTDKTTTEPTDKTTTEPTDKTTTEPTDKTTTEPTDKTTTEPTDKTTKFTVVPRKGGQGNNRLFGYDVKDANGNTIAKFGVKEKEAAEAEAARLNGGSSTTSSDEPSSKLDVKKGDLSTSKAPVFKTQDEAAKVVKQFAEFADEILPQLSAEEQRLFKEIIGAANKKPVGTPTPADTGLPVSDF
jgi:peptidoglycan hydrolase-like protein with peptidoglycan-binding domain